MLHFLQKLRNCLYGFLLLLVVTSGWSQQESVSQNWDTHWTDWDTRSDLSPTDRLVGLTQLLLNLNDPSEWRKFNAWERVGNLLAEWEASPDIDIARDSYFRLLDHTGWIGFDGGLSMAEEESFRSFIQRGLAITENPVEEGKLLFHLASSVFRSEMDSLETRRRVSAYLQQAALALGRNSAAGQVHFFLGNLYSGLQSEAQIDSIDEESPYARAVFHYRFALQLDGISEELRSQVNSALDELLKPELEVDIDKRFLPQTDIRFSISTRNLNRVDVKVVELPWLSNGSVVSIGHLEDAVSIALEDENLSQFESPFRIASGNRVDWTETVIRLGDQLASGWYGVQVDGGGLVQQHLLLVTSLEVILVPRENGDLAVWAVDAETGQTKAGIHYHLLDSFGDPVYSGTCDESGMASIYLDSDTDWAELHLADELNPAVVKRDSILEGIDPSPWVIPASVTVLPGRELEFVLMTPDEYPAGVVVPETVQLADGGELLPRELPAGVSPAHYTVTLPNLPEAFGPVYLKLSNGSKVMLSSLERAEKLPLQVEFSGEQFLEGKNIYVSSSPVGVRIRKSDTAKVIPSDYIRIVARSLTRHHQETNARPDDPEGEVVLENIISFGGSGSNDLYFELPSVAIQDEIVVLKVEVYPLGSEELVGEAVLSLVPYRTLVSLDCDKHIISPGESASVLLNEMLVSDSMARAPEGELVVFSESWENQYIHRRRGTLISETEYLALPARSLLGTAKTDYRRLEQGSVREEQTRIPLGTLSVRSIPVSFDQPGYYRVQFVGRESDTVAYYPGGELEFWVLPEDSRDYNIRTNQPRLVLEHSGDGGNEILVLLDRPNVSVLIDMGYASGKSSTRVFRPDATAIHLVLPLADDELVSCTAIVVGERETDFLCEHIEVDENVSWQLLADQRAGLNPESEFVWDVRLQSGLPATEPFWVFYPEESLVLIQESINEQRRQRHIEMHNCQLEAVSVASWLPIYNPLGFTSAGEQPDSSPADSNLHPLALLSYYPELSALGFIDDGLEPIQVTADEDEANKYQLAGRFPAIAGRWSLVSFSPAGINSLATQTWSCSTELPIRSSLLGPPFLRLGDKPVVTLSADNTTPERIPVKLDLSITGGAQLNGLPPVLDSLRAGEELKIPVSLAASTPGEAQVRAELLGRSTSSASAWSSDVLETLPDQEMDVFVIEPGNPAAGISFDPAGWEDPYLFASAGIGGLLQHIWPLHRAAYLSKEPLLAALIDWAHERVQYHHGVLATFDSEKADRLMVLIGEYGSGGGVSWTAGRAADPWLSALVYWSIETFSPLSDNGFDSILVSARDYLETVLIDESIPVESRLFALRALAAPANHNPRLRPSRIQAKTFLDFLLNRDQLRIREVSLLLDVARTYHFNEEVRLLSDYVRTRIANPVGVRIAGIFGATLLYQSMGSMSQTSDLKYPLMDAFMAELSGSVSAISWEKAAGLLNLLAVFLWDGDFSVEGKVAITFPGSNPLEVPLQPNDANRGVYERSLEMQAGVGPVDFGFDATASPHPIIVVISGLRSTQVEPGPYPEQSEHLFREFIEETLLRGSHLHQEPADLESVYLPSETLQLHTQIYVEGNQPYAEIIVPVPSGASIGPDGIQHSLVASTSDAIGEVPEISFVTRENPLEKVVRIQPFSPGRHEFIISYKLEWSGTYIFPARKLTFPKTGDSYKLGEDGILSIGSEE